MGQGNPKSTSWPLVVDDSIIIVLREAGLKLFLKMLMNDLLYGFSPKAEIM